MQEEKRGHLQTKEAVCVETSRCESGVRSKALKMGLSVYSEFRAKIGVISVWRSAIRTLGSSLGTL